MGEERRLVAACLRSVAAGLASRGHAEAWIVGSFCVTELRAVQSEPGLRSRHAAPVPPRDNPIAGGGQLSIHSPCQSWKLRSFASTWFFGFSELGRRGYSGLLKSTASRPRSCPLSARYRSQMVYQGIEADASKQGAGAAERKQDTGALLRPDMVATHCAAFLYEQVSQIEVVATKHR